MSIPVNELAGTNTVAATNSGALNEQMTLVRGENS
jgi:hypothetical protein